MRLWTNWIENCCGELYRNQSRRPGTQARCVTSFARFSSETHPMLLVVLVEGDGGVTAEPWSPRSISSLLTPRVFPDGPYKAAQR